MKPAAAFLLPLLFTAAATAANVTSRITPLAPVTTGSVAQFQFTLMTDAPVTNAMIVGQFPSYVDGPYGDGFLVLGIEAPGWNCLGQLTGSFSCNRAEVAAGSHSVIVRAIAPNVAGTARISGYANGNGDLDPGNNGFVVDMPVTSSGVLSDVSITFGSVPSPVPLNTPSTLTAVVRNNGPASVSNVFVRLYPGTPKSETTFRGWSCEWNADLYAICQTGPIAPGGFSRLEYDLPAQEFPTEIAHRAESWVAGIDETKPEDNKVFGSTTIGTTGEFAFLLLPVAIFETPGAAGARWRSDVSYFVTGNEPVSLFPFFIECRVTCLPDPPFGYPSDAGITTVVQGGLRPIEQPGRLFYTEKENVKSIFWSLNIRDTARALENAGTELPVITEKDLHSKAMQLISIPTNPQFRLLLRIYDPSAGTGTRATIRIYNSDGMRPEPLIGQMMVDLAVPADNTATPLGLPISPGYSQIPLNGELFPGLSSASRIRVEVTPNDPARPLWAFVSITNNLTNLITTVTPQPSGTR
jgi:hypothetical protein